MGFRCRPKTAAIETNIIGLAVLMVKCKEETYHRSQETSFIAAHPDKHN
jgi:hypothetical protein